MRVPLGVIGMIYEARPSVTADVAALTIKSGNAVLLKGGVEASKTNRAIMEAITAGINHVGLVPCDCVQLIDPTNRRIVEELIRADAFVDLLVPRGEEPNSISCRKSNNTRSKTFRRGVSCFY